MSEIITGEAVALELRLAKLPSRLIAGLLDLMLQLMVLYLFTIVTAPVLGSTDPGFAVALYILFLVAIFVGYPVTMETLTRGRTLGKMAMGIRVVRVDGGPVGFRQALVRGLFAGLLEKPGMFFGFTMPLAVVVMLVNSNGRRLGDLTAGTVVLQERVPAPQAAYFAAMPPPLAGWAPTLDLTGLDDGLALAVRQFLSRLHQLDPSARTHLGNRLVDAVAAATTPAPPPGTPGWAYLTAVLAERRRREEQRLAARQPAAPYGPARYGPQYGPPRYGPQYGPRYGPPRYGPPAQVPAPAPPAPPVGPFAPPG